MENEITIEFSVDIACTNTHPVAGIVIDPLESEVLEAAYSIVTTPGTCPCAHRSALAMNRMDTVRICDMYTIMNVPLQPAKHTP